jgi:AbrB family looped-hinge helix DNA binding protein
MNAQTKMSEKGQVVIPKDVRDSLGLSPGQQFDVLQAGSDIVLRPTGRTTGKSVEEVMADLRARVRYAGPIIPVEQLSWSPEFEDGRSA